VTGTSEIYDALAPHYREYSAKKSAYLAAVDGFVVGNIPARASSLLDVGAGDGVRGMDIARRAKIGKVVLSDPSPEMIARCRQLEPDDVWHSTAEALPETGLQFDVILCLWNVLGHLAGRDARVQALSRMRQLLAPGGTVFFDVNNRHNASGYGWLEVAKRRIIDAVAFDERRGDATFDWNVGGRFFPAMGHLFTPAEIRGIAEESGLHIVKNVAVNYATGVISQSKLRGQLLFMTTADRDQGS
jgi:SAM-dependent methyltransferase